MATGTRRQVTYQRQKARRQLDPFFRSTGLVELPDGQGTNHDFGATGQTALTLPGSARLAFSYSVPLADGVVSVDISGGRSFSHPALAADEIFRGEWGEETKDITINRGAAPAGVASVYIVDDIGRNFVIGTATFV